MQHMLNDNNSVFNNYNSLLKLPTSALSIFKQNKIQHNGDTQKQFWISFVAVSAYIARYLVMGMMIFLASFLLQYGIQHNFSNNDS